jgi:signal transduction histidine kinase/ligand-binding sensor domain-containing protein/DNA-binding NarL/FixJ family response regulator
MKSKLFIFSLILSISALHAANTKFYSINSMYGIFLRESASICSDKNGFIWASSKTGILRLTEDDYRLYKLPYVKAGYFVKVIYRNNILYAYSNNGEFFYYDAVKDRFELMFNFRKLSKHTFMNVHNIEVDNNGTFWIATAFGLYKYSKGKLLFIGEKQLDTSYVTWYDYRHLLKADAKGLFLIDKESLKTSCLLRSSSIGFSLISKLYYDKRQNKLWIGTISSGLYRYDFKTKSLFSTKISSFPKQPILAIEANTDSTMLVGIDGQGIWEVDRKNAEKIVNVYKENADDSYSLRGDGVYDIYCAKDKRVWVGTYSGGVSFFEQKPPLVLRISHDVNKINSLCNNYINSIIEDKNGNIWFATNNGISKWNVKNDSWNTYYHNEKAQAQVFLSLCEDNQGRVWAGTYSSGAYVLDANTGREVAHYSQKSNRGMQISDFVFDIFKDSQGDIWIGSTQGGDIKCYLTKENRFKSYPSQPVNKFYELSPGKILLACTYALCLLDKQTSSEQILLGEYFSHDVTASNGKSWLGTRGDGLISYDFKSKKEQKFTVKTGLPSNFISGIMKVGDYLWLGTESGLCRFNIKTNTVINYASLLSLSHVSFNPSSHCLLRNGNLLWGTNDGAVLFNPSTIQDIKTNGTIYFQDLTVSGRSIKDNSTIKLTTPLDSLQELTLNYNQNTLTLELLPLGMNASDSKFSWKMEGFDAEWSQLVNRRLITYTNLPNGKFVLKVRLYDSSMSHIVAERSILIHIIPPVWKRWWFVMFMLLIIISIIYLSLRYYVNYLKQLHTEEKVRFFANTAHDIRTSLTLINAPIEELKKERSTSEAGKYYLHLAAEQAKRLSVVVTQLMDFQKIDVGKEHLSCRMVDVVHMLSLQKIMFESLAQSKDIAISFSTNSSSYFSAVDEAVMEKVIGNLISNAIKYSHPKGKIQLNLTCNSENWILEVIDQGIGISRRAQTQLFKEFYRADNAINTKIIGSGIGLLLAKNYVVMHGGKISCDSQENVGSRFKIDIPYKEVPYFQVGADIDPNFVNEPDDSFLVEMDPQMKRMKVLIVDDNDDLLKFMRFSLGEEFDICTAEDGVQAWTQIQNEIPDLVVSDIMMPEMDGFELCKLIKSTYETSHIPVILLSALSEKAELLHGLGLGADDYLTKPFDITILLQRIKSIIHNRESVREKALQLINNDNNKESVIFANENNDVFVKKALAIVSENMNIPEFGKDEFASAMNVSASLLYKKIKSLTGQSPVDFIKSVRLNHAICLLKTREYTVTEVSELCGFASVGYFGTVFRKHFGKSPTDILNLE